MLRNFQCRRGLYILGAGASAGSAPIGKDFFRAPARSYLRDFCGFSPIIPVHSELTQRMIDASHDISISEILPGREIRPSTEVAPYAEIVQRLNNYSARLDLKHLLAKARFSGQPSDSYRVFQFFYPSLIANYNHDGLAAEFCGRFHHVLDMHGSIESEYGSPHIAALVAQVREFDLPDEPDGLLMGAPEPHFNQRLDQLLLKVTRFSPAFIAIIGYSFAQNREGYDDRVSLDCFLDARREFHGNIYVIQPEPDALRETIADGIKSKNVFGIQAYWNVLAHAFMKASYGQSDKKSLDCIYGQLRDTYGSDVVFPRSYD